MRILIVVLLAPILAACDVGEGNKPEAIRFVASSTDGTTLTAKTVYQCFAQGSLVVADFTDGIPGDFTSRVTYSSDNPAVLRVSNGDIRIPGVLERNYARGALVPVSAGTATITARFAGLEAVLPVTVEAPVSLAVKNEQFRDSTNTLREVEQMVPGSTQQLRAILNEGLDSEADVTTLGEWTTTAPEEIADIDASRGVVFAFKLPAAPDIYDAAVSFAPCSGAEGASALPQNLDASKLKAQYSVSAPVGPLVIATEPGYPANGMKMVNGSRQLLRVLADFDAAPGEGQDLTYKEGFSDASGIPTRVTFTSSPAERFTFVGALLAACAPSALNTLCIGDADIQASFGPINTATVTRDSPTYASATLKMGVEAATLDEIRLDVASFSSPDPVPFPFPFPAPPAPDVLPPTLAATTIDAGESRQLVATGIFSAAGVPKFSRLINHDVSWASNSLALGIATDTITASVGAAGLTPGFLGTAEVTTDVDAIVTVNSLNLIPPTGTSPQTSIAVKVEAAEAPAP